MKTVTNNEANALTQTPTATPVPPQSTIATDSAKPSPKGCSHKEHGSNGKIARLPKAVRDQLSQMIIDGVPYREIRLRLGDHGKHLTVNNISNWKTDGGLQRFIDEKERMDDCRLRRDMLREIATDDSGTETYQAGPKMAIALLVETLINRGPETLRKSLETDPRNAYRLLNSLARLLHGGLRCEQHLLELSDRKANSETPEAKPGGITPETRKLIETELRLL